MIRAYIMLLLRGYKAYLSPMLPNACRFVPTCSEYASEAIDRYGVIRGGWKAARRLLRCHPFSPGGYDPVILPEDPAGTPEVGEVCRCSEAFPARVEAVPQPEFNPNLRPLVRRC